MFDNITIYINSSDLHLSYNSAVTYAYIVSNKHCLYLLYTVENESETALFRKTPRT